MSEKKQKFGEAGNTWRSNERAVSDYYITISSIYGAVQNKKAQNDPEYSPLKPRVVSAVVGVISDASYDAVKKLLGTATPQIFQTLEKEIETHESDLDSEFAKREPQQNAYYLDENFTREHEKWERNKEEFRAFYTTLKDNVEKVKKERAANSSDNSVERELLLGKVVVSYDKDGNPQYTPAGDDYWSGIAEKDVFIDDLIRYADAQTGKTLLDTLCKLRDSITADEAKTLTGVARKRYEETRQLVDRGLRMIGARYMTGYTARYTAGDTAGYTPEYTDEILRLSYKMSKDGLREAVRSVDFTGIKRKFPTSVILPGYDCQEHIDLESSVGAFLSGNGPKLTLGGTEYRSITEYVASKMTVDAFNEIQEVHLAQGDDSYASKAVERKFAVLRSMGIDIGSYGSWDDMEKYLSKSGFWTAKNHPRLKARDCYPTVFSEIKANPANFNACCQGQTTMDAAIQLILENLDMPGNDRNNRSMILFRTENIGSTAWQEGENIGLSGYRPGVCESYGHISVTAVGDIFAKKALVVSRVPYSRIHSLWFMEHYKIGNDGAVEKTRDNRIMGNINLQFWAGYQNEIDACAAGLPIIYAGEAWLGKQGLESKARAALLDWEKKNP